MGSTARSSGDVAFWPASAQRRVERHGSYRRISRRQWRCGTTDSSRKWRMDHSSGNKDDQCRPPRRQLQSLSGGILSEWRGSRSHLVGGLKRDPAPFKNRLSILNHPIISTILREIVSPCLSRSSRKVSSRNVPPFETPTGGRTPSLLMMQRPIRLSPPTSPQAAPNAGTRAIRRQRQNITFSRHAPRGRRRHRSGWSRALGRMFLPVG